ncbi:MAG: trypsin-like peptidase domain-containing protein, partial [Nitrospinota bacterium]|nr:trypsin-like peptidase domain-containing protein [Nitrospinota bacterium]
LYSRFFGFNLTVKLNTLKLLLSIAILLATTLLNDISSANNSNDLSKKAFNLFADGKLNTAIQTYLKVLKIQPDSAETHHYLGLLYFQIGRGPQAINHFNKAKLLYKNSNDQKSKPNLSIIKNNLERAYKKFDLKPEYFSANTLTPAKQDWKPTGIGFFVGKEGYLLTTTSSIQGGDKIRVRFANGEIEPVILVRKLIIYKIAILKLMNANKYLYKWLEFENKPHFKEGKTVYTMDFSKLQNPNPSMSKGIIIKENGLDNSNKIVELDLTLKENRDGGPLFNKNGKIIGLLLGKSKAKKSFAYLKNSSENSSFAIKSSYLKKIIPHQPKRRHKDTTNKENFNSGINVKNISKEAINNFAFLEVFN